MKKYISASNGNLDNLPDGRYLVKYGKAYYQLSFDFHNCTYAIDPVGDTRGAV